ncbi:MAG TPA: alpha/beta fold hydrolase [Deltaproteobacteria bacterium]|nr:alpha/beta fold hydrolase [Deltaproteobacteria bacterium]HOI06067.1 alpha/beta fold hydrolase [Deltaproteobacteria bacterium]
MTPGWTSCYLSNIPSQFLPLRSFLVHCVSMGEGHPLILVHGGGMWLYSFRHNMEPLSRSFRVHALDMPGYGYTVPLRDTRRYGLETMSETLLQFMDAMGIDTATLAGHSWGGGWILHFASTHPERVSSLVLIDSSGLDVPDVPEWEFLKVPVVGPLLLRLLTVSAVQKRLERSYHQPGMVTRDMALEVYLPLMLRHNRRAQALISRNQDWGLTERAMPGIRQPVLVMWGESDRYLPVGLVERFRRHLPQAKTHVLRECGHSPHEERPHAANRLISTFVSRDVLGAR